MGSAAGTIAIARRYIGYHEGSNNSTIFGNWFGLPHSPWCAEFCSFCLYSSGTKGTGGTNKGFAYTPTGVAWFKARGLWFPSTQSRPGDLIFYDWNGGQHAEHVGLVEYGWNGSYTGTIEGNRGDKVGRFHTGNGSTTMGVGRPKYSGASPAPAPVKKPPVNATHPQWPGRFLALTSPNMHGTDVKNWQSRMRQHGLTVTADGYYGPATAKVTKAFQKSRKLIQDGVVGPVTWHAAWA